MNPDTNELVRGRVLEKLPKMLKKGFRPVPQHLDKAANQVLGKKDMAVVSKTSGGKLSKWAAKKRKRGAELKKMVEACNAYYS